jgi:hypothetical protein
VNYGFGYAGVGFGGGRWVGNSFAYNQSVTNVNVTVVHNTYNETVINNNVTVNRVSYNGGTGGTAAAPTAQERMAAQESHVPATPAQQQHVQQAAANPALMAKNNGGHPSIAATPRPSAFNAPGVVGARGAGAPPHAPPVAQLNKAHGAPGGQPQAGHPVQTHGGAHPAAHAQTANAGGKPKAKPHPKNQPEKHQDQTAQR